MVTDRQVAVTSVVSGVLWTVGSFVVVAGVLTELYGIPAIGLLMAGGGGVLNMRSFVMRCEARMRDAFEAGRDYQRNQGQQVRSV